MPVTSSVNKYVIFRQQLDKLLTHCSKCGQPVTKKRRFTTGSMLSVKIECHGGHSYVWQSQPMIKKVSIGNVLISAAILFTGLTHSRVAEMAACLGLLYVTQLMIKCYQKEVLFPVMKEAWEQWEHEREGTSSRDVPSLSWGKTAGLPHWLGM